MQSAFFVNETLCGDCLTFERKMLISLKIMSWSLSGVNVSTLFTKYGVDMHSRSNVRSFLVGLSTTCVRS